MYRKNLSRFVFCKTSAEPVRAREESARSTNFYLFGIKCILPMKWCRFCGECVRRGGAPVEGAAGRNGGPPERGVKRDVKRGVKRRGMAGQPAGLAGRHRRRLY
jgi:hypothetical protein